MNRSAEISRLEDASHRSSSPLASDQLPQFRPDRFRKRLAICHRMVHELAAASELLLLEQHNIPLALDAMTKALVCIDLETRIAEQNRTFDEVNVNIMNQADRHIISEFLTHLVLSQQDQVWRILCSIGRCRKQQQDNENCSGITMIPDGSRRPKILRASQCDHLLESNRGDWACSMSCVVLYNIGIAYCIMNEPNTRLQSNAALQSYQAAFGASSLIIDSSQSNLMKCQTLRRIEELVGQMEQRDESIAENVRVIREHLLAAEITVLFGGCPSAAAAA